ncbi:hypothetical protein [Lentzea fradiae]|uniref:hypothetical protein n=1 Tax=Lentzea fradiae TaxID=200378 RepID=UPI00115FD6C5|nr:hypothetical protein [Lentzea fradiae]
MTTSPAEVQTSPQGVYRLRLAPREVRELRKYLSVIVARVRAAMIGGSRTPGKLVVDLDGATDVPVVQLVMLVKLLRRNLGGGVHIELSGVRPAVVGSLVAFGIPQDVSVTDSRGRAWTG